MKHITPICTTIASAVIAALFAASSVSAATLATFDFESDTSPFVDVANFSGVSVTDLTPGAKLATDNARSEVSTPTDGGVGSYFARGAALNQPDSNTSDAFVDAQSEGGYLEFTVTADPGQALNLTALNFDAARNSGNTSDMRILVTSDVTGFTFADRLDISEITTGTNTLVDVLQSNEGEIGISPAGAGSAWGNADNTVATLGSEFTNITSATFRLYAFTRLDASPNNANVMRFDNIAIEGTTAGASHYEPFVVGTDPGDYTAETNIQGQNTPPTDGFLGTWTGTSITYLPKTDNMAYTSGQQSLDTTGGSVQVNAPSNADREVSRTTEDISSEVFYISSLMRIDADAGENVDNDFAYAQLSDGGVVDNRIQWGVIDGDIALRTRSTSNAVNTKYEIADGYEDDHTYLFVLKIEKNVSGFDDRITVWVDPTDLSSEGASAFDLEVLVRPYFDSTVFDDFLLRSINFTSPFEFQFDELRIGSTWSQVLPFTAIPTPAALPAGLILLTAAAARRRRRIRG